MTDANRLPVHRRWQIACVATGMSGFLAALAGSAWENVAITQGGLLVFAAALLIIVVIGIVAGWTRRGGRGGNETSRREQKHQS